MELTAEQSRAHELFIQHKKIDPFPEIKPALLNWDDIIRYVEKTGMIFPFDKKDLRPGSYEVRLLGKCVYYTEGCDLPMVLEIGKGDELIIEKNSIYFLTIEPLIQLPDYIAARFNLKVDMVYKGFLLGTGPLVDPGFYGNLSFPLHNLTTNSYHLRGGDIVAGMEFTKLSSHKVYESKTEFPGDEIKGVPYEKDLRDVWDYMCEAHSEAKHKGSIRSSIPDAMAEAKTSAINAERSAKDASDKIEAYVKKARYFSYASLIAILILVVSIAKFFFTVSDSINKSEEIQAEMLKEARVQVSEIRQEVNGIEEKLDSLVKVNSDSTKNDAISPSKTTESTRQPPHQE